MTETTQDTKQEKPAAAAKTTKNASPYDRLPRMGRHAKALLAVILEKSAELDGIFVAIAVKRDDADAIARLDQKADGLRNQIVNGVDMLRNEIDNARTDEALRAARKARGAK